MSKKIKKSSELIQAIAAILPDATVDVDNEGQIIVYTNLWHVGGDNLDEGNECERCGQCCVLGDDNLCDDCFNFGEDDE